MSFKPPAIIALWVRLFVAYQPPAEAGIAETFGLDCFGSPNIEIRAHRLNRTDSLSAAMSHAESRLTTGQPTWKEATTTIEDIATFRIDLLD